MNIQMTTKKNVYYQSQAHEDFIAAKNRNRAPRPVTQKLMLALCIIFTLAAIAITIYPA